MAVSDQWVGLETGQVLLMQSLISIMLFYSINFWRSDFHWLSLIRNWKPTKAKTPQIPTPLIDINIAVPTICWTSSSTLEAGESVWNIEWLDILRRIWARL